MNGKGYQRRKAQVSPEAEARAWSRLYVKCGDCGQRIMRGSERCWKCGGLDRRGKER
jgi:uncharacterized OB-fold protein